MRLWTRGDMDGLTSAVFITMVEDVRELCFAHPKDVQDGVHSLGAEDILVNLPYVPGVGLWFDHHVSEDRRLGGVPADLRGRYELAPSAARVVYNHYRRPEFERFRDLLEATDRLDSAQLTRAEVENPEGWILLGLTLDPRSGLGPEFQKYFRWLVEVLKELPLEKVLDNYVVRTRAERVRSEAEEQKALLRRAARLDGNVIVTDLRGIKEKPAGNRFLVYTLFPEADVEVRLLDGKEGKNTVIAVGHSIFNRACPVNVGELLGKLGGGGHRGAGTCQVARDRADETLATLLGTLRHPVGKKRK